jgi:VIT1/CCC1 family predicted Fe2+/Mn2+ transporter
LDQEIEKAILTAQKNEITEHHVYGRLSRSMKAPHNRDILQKIAEDEKGHYHFWKEITRQDVKPNRWAVWKYTLISRLLGITFGIKLMERGEAKAQASYAEIGRSIPGAQDIQNDEYTHEKELVGMIDEERLKYVGSVVLGLNDALVELTGALAGFTLALQNARFIAMAGLITGIAASLSMAASEYLSTKTEGGSQDPWRAAVYTGSTYILTVLFLIFPYFVTGNYFAALGVTLGNAVLLILLFNFYVSVAKDIPFWKRFLEMASISLGVAALSFVMGFLVRIFLNVDM